MHGMLLVLVLVLLLHKHKHKQQPHLRKNGQHYHLT
jgi:hypothetical protein